MERPGPCASQVFEYVAVERGLYVAVERGLEVDVGRLEPGERGAEPRGVEENDVNKVAPAVT